MIPTPLVEDLARELGVECELARLRSAGAQDIDSALSLRIQELGASSYSEALAKLRRSASEPKQEVQA